GAERDHGARSRRPGGGLDRHRLARRAGDRAGGAGHPAPGALRDRRPRVSPQPPRPRPGRAPPRGAGDRLPRPLRPLLHRGHRRVRERSHCRPPERPHPWHPPAGPLRRPGDGDRDPGRRVGDIRRHRCHDIDPAPGRFRPADGAAGQPAARRRVLRPVRKPGRRPSPHRPSAPGPRLPPDRLCRQSRPITGRDRALARVLRRLPRHEPGAAGRAGPLRARPSRWIARGGGLARCRRPAAGHGLRQRRNRVRGLQIGRRPRGPHSGGPGDYGLGRPAPRRVGLAAADDGPSADARTRGANGPPVAGRDPPRRRLPARRGPEHRAHHPSELWVPRGRQRRGGAARVGRECGRQRL
ncbi:MAG: hypothetical protein AVDCRST_MAG73-2425, partial [uncultured Thermomicrobiales bacterium]